MAGPSPAAIATSRSSREARLACAAQPGKHHLTSPQPKMIFVTCKSDAHPGPSRPVVQRGTGCGAHRPPELTRPGARVGGAEKGVDGTLGPEEGNQSAIEFLDWGAGGAARCLPRLVSGTGGAGWGRR
jgi:hypothetical protein